jgi:hypothetical protein
MNTLYIRKAQHDWICGKCGATIKKGTEYKDLEIKQYSWNGVNICHIRTCKVCQKKIYSFKEKEPVSFGDTKEWLVGKGRDRNGHRRLLTLDWDLGEYHWRPLVYNADGHALHYSNVRFV